MDASSEPVLDDLRWLRALARRLVRDPERADDAVQDALVSGLERPPRDARARRGWLATVLRNALRQDGRAGARRAAREREHDEGSTDASERSALDAAAELELHRKLLERVHALDEPYRTAIVLRFLRERTPAEIARELGVPVKTVRTRIDRGLASLRERLGPERERWLALLALPRRILPGAGGASLLSWILPMNLKLVAGAAAVLLAGTVLVLQRSSTRATPEPAAAPADALADAPAERPGGPALFDAPAPLGGERAAAPATVPTPGAPEVAPLPEVRGSVRTLDGAGIAGVEVEFERGARSGHARRPDDPSAVSGPDGEFALALPEEPGRLVARSDALACIASPRLEGTPPLAPPIVVVAPARTYAGTVVEPSGAPVPLARVEVTLPGSFVQSRDVGGAAVHLLLPFAETRADEHGRFRFERAASVEGAVLAASADGLGTASLALPEASHEALEIVLGPAPASERTIHGIVLDPAGAPVAGADVALGWLAVESDAGGRFALALEDWQEAGTLRALEPGYLPAELPFDAATRPSSPERPVELHLGGEPLAIRGRVLDADGEPVPDAMVWTSDVTPFGRVVHEEGGHSFLGETTVETRLAGIVGPWSTPITATAGADGEFELAGLLDRRYAVFALDPRTLEGAGPVELAAGDAGTRVVLARRRTIAVAGRVVSRSGAPLAGVTVTPGRGFGWRADRGANAGDWAGWYLTSPEAARLVPEAAAETDAEGRFALAPLVAEGLFLSLRGTPLVLGARYDVADAIDPGALEIAVDAASRFRVELARADEADSFALEDLAGEHVGLFIEVEGSTISAPDADLDGGRSGVVLAREGEYALVLRSGGETVRRAPVLLPAGGLHEIRP